MGLIPVYFSVADLTVGEPDQRHAFELPPTTSAEPGLEALPLADGEINGYRFYVGDVAEKLEIDLHDSSVTPVKFACNGGLTTRLQPHERSKCRTASHC